MAEIVIVLVFLLYLFFNVAFSFVYGLPPHAEVSGYRFQPQRQRHILEDTLEASDHEKKDTREAELTKKN